ncbi:MAG: protein kinase, partial [Verrucomicrobiales bacterium]|nr:protein kinase [Verrucomicrobiales bacterium]
TEDLTITGQVLGTPNYMPPEQADPSRGQTTVASDVYSLGAILCQMLTGRPPFLAETLTQTLRLVAEAEPVSLRLLNPNVPPDLEAICLKCLEKDPKRRYASAQELAHELSRFLRDEPIRARQITSTARLWRWCRRKPALALSLGAAAALLLVVAIGSPIAIIRINGARQLAEAARQQEIALRIRAQAAERETQQQLYAALLEQARTTVRSGELGQRVHALDAIRRAAAISNTVELRREAFAALALPDLRFERQLTTGSDCTMAVLDPKFERLATCRGTNAVEIRSVNEQRLLAILPASKDEPATFGKWSLDGRFLAIRRGELRNAADALTHVEVWDLSMSRTADGPRPQHVLTATDAGQSNALLHNEAAATGDRSRSENVARHILSLPRSPWSAFAFHPSLPRILSGDVGDSVSVWDLESRQLIARFALTGLVHHLEFSPDGGTFIAQHRIGRPWFITSLLDAATGAVRKSASSGWIDGVAWDPKDHWIALAVRDGDIQLLDPNSGETNVLGRHKKEAPLQVRAHDSIWFLDIFDGTMASRQCRMTKPK